MSARLVFGWCRSEATETTHVVAATFIACVNSVVLVRSWHGLGIGSVGVVAVVVVVGVVGVVGVGFGRIGCSCWWCRLSPVHWVTWYAGLWGPVQVSGSDCRG